MLEIEVKIKINNTKHITEKILDQGATLLRARYFEKNTLYDYSSRELYKKQQALRLREINKRTILTFKGPQHKSRKFKIREEYETEVRDRKQIKKIFKSLGLSPAFHYEKTRTIYKKKRLKICLDETPIGNYLELEGTQGDIVKFAQALGFSKKEFINLDYIQLTKNFKKEE